MRKPAANQIHSTGIIKRLAERFRGREQMLVRGPEEWPLLLLSYPRGNVAIAEEVRQAWLHTLPGLRASGARAYREMLPRLPAIVVVFLRPRNVCSCLGHHHPQGTESRLTKRLAHDIGSEVGEIDLAWEAIRAWRPYPIMTLASESRAFFGQTHFRTALLTVLLHELQHLAHPGDDERTVRTASDDFYTEVLEELV